MKKCENCGIEHDGTYGSGRFCSNKCARGFSTKDKRKEINEKVSKKRKEHANSGVSIICKFCGNTFTAQWNKRHKKYCSRSCAAKSLSDKSRKTISIKMMGKNSGEKNGMYGKSPKNTKNIQIFSSKHQGNHNLNVRSSYEKRFIEELNGNVNVNYFLYEPKKFKVKYFDEKGTKRTYQPDFLINGIKIVEIKNKWNVKLEETRIKEEAFRKTFKIDYEIKVY